jgi:hypothetical protein
MEKGHSMLGTLENKIANALLQVFASDSPLRKRFSDPERIIQGAGARPGQKALEVGCGRGFFTLQLGRLLPELHRVLAPGGSLAAWTAVPGWSPEAVVKNGSFSYLGKQNNVHKFSRL